MTQTSRKEKLNEGTDLKRVMLLFAGKLWLVLAAVIVGAGLGALVYTIYAGVKNAHPTYQKSTDYYIEFNHKDYPDGMDYYNAYTWGQFIKDDKIVGYAIAAEDGITPQDIYDCVSSVMVSDYRVLTVQVKSKDKSKVEAISRAYESAMPSFANDVKEISSVSLWSSDELTIADEYTHTANATFLGGLIGLIAALFVWAVYYVMDDRIYTETDFKRYFEDVAFIGYDCDGYKEDFDCCYKQLVKDKAVVESSNVSKDIEEIKKAGACVIDIEWGKVSVNALRYDMELLKKQSCETVGVKMSKCNVKFLKAYYGRKR